ncbi:MAG: nucleotide sugar dehydrogenase [bacterium]
MNILYIGAGFVGTCSAAVSAASGHHTLVYDIDQGKIDSLSSSDRDIIESCLFEKGLSDLLLRNKENISFTTDYARVEEFLDDCDAVFMCLPTPEIGETGESDLKYYFSAADKLAVSLIKRNQARQEKYTVIVNKSTVPINMVDKTQEVLDEAGVKKCGVVSNPEFLVEGKAMLGSLKPDRVVVGAWQEKDFVVMRRVYQRFYDSATVKYIETNPKEAAAGKLLANFYLFNKLAVCFDVIGRSCESFAGLKFENLREILTSDPRIGNWGFYDSLYAGGSCFIKDARSLSHQLKVQGKNTEIVDQVYLANKRQLHLFLDRAQKQADFDWVGKKVALLGTAFKQDTNDIRNSASIDMIDFFKEKQVSKIKLYDPAAMENFKQVFPSSDLVSYHDTALEAIKDSDIIIISTDWPQFRRLGDLLVNLENRPLVMDGRRILQNRYDELQQIGFDIIAVGSPFIKGKK